MTACEKLNEHALKNHLHIKLQQLNFIRIMNAEQTSIDSQINTITATKYRTQQKNVGSYY